MSHWILLRGLMRESRHWGDFPAMLSKVARVENIVAPDLPGNGKLNHLQSSASIEEMVESVRAQLKGMQLQPPYSVLALSMGGMVAVAWAEMYPQELQRMVLINTSLAGYSPFYQRLRPENYPSMLLSPLFRSVRQREKRVFRLTSNMARFSGQHESILNQWIRYATENPVSISNALRQLQSAMRYRAKHAPSVPVLLLCSEHDRLVNAKCSIALAEKWHAEIRVHHAAGHDLPLDDGEWVTEQVKGWLKRD
jgi:pimeloyl-ACP methyl ester carboxylesterase